MPDRPLAACRALVFDAYGTLFDVQAPVARACEALGPRAETLASLWRQKQLEYAWLRSLMGAHADFWQVTQDALDVALATLRVEDAALRARLLSLYQRLDAYPDVKPLLQRLKAAGRPAAIFLTNGAPGMIAGAVRAAGLEDLLEAVLSVEEVGIYKPHPSVYRLAVDRLGVPADAIGFVSSNAWDASGAAHFGFTVAWLDRSGRVPDRLPGRIVARIGELDAL